MACAVCGEPVFPGRSGGEIVMWLHRADLSTVWSGNADLTPEEIEAVRARLGIEGTDHVAVPVGIDEIRGAARCDFCSGPNPDWTLPVEKFEANAQQGSSGDWLACEVCARAIKKNQWDKVLRRAVDTAAVKHGAVAHAPEHVNALKATFAQVREYQTGPIRRT